VVFPVHSPLDFPEASQAAFFPLGRFSSSSPGEKEHKSKLSITNLSQADWTLLGQNKSVILAPESIEGPFCE
jgi:hypothetical protein